MTFRIDSIFQENAVPWRWFCAFKGFRGEGVYGRAVLDVERKTLEIESTMDSNARLLLPMVSGPTAASRNQIRGWFGEQFEALGWGPEVDQGNEPTKKRPGRAGP